MSKTISTFREELALAALLHDIGKFMQRSEQWTKQEGIKHQQLSASFINMLSGDSDTPNLPGSKAISYLAGFHHEQDLNTLDEVTALYRCAEILSEADNLSSGERKKEKTTEQKPLRSVFSSVYGHGAPSYWNIAPLGPETIGVPSETVPDKTSLKKAYNKHWDDFTREFRFLLAHTAGENKLETILHLLKKYLWCVPASFYMSEPDISLFDHCRMTSAIAVSLLDWLAEKSDIDQVTDKGRVRRIVKDRDEERYLLICGDISGIQGFIYQVAEKGAARALKGRSFYLQLLSDAVAKYVLRSLGYPLTNLIYSSGGKFYALVSATAEGRINELKNKINKFLLNETSGELYFSIGAVKMKGSDFMLSGADGQTTQINQRWEEVNRVNSRDKMRRYAGIIDHGFFTPNDDASGNPDRASAELDELEKSNQFSKDMEELGKEIRRENFILAELEGDKGGTKATGMRVGFDALGISYRILKVSKQIEELKFERAVLYNVNHSDNFLMSSLSREGVDCGFKFYGGNLQPQKKDGELLTFDQLADASSGIKRLGVLRMDVDNLGMVFREGFGELYTISRVSTLSLQLDLYFNAVIHHVLNSDDDLRDRVLLVYTGGDDLFAVGAWDATVKAAKVIKDSFSIYCSSNSKFTLSAGLAITGRKHPIRQGAMLAGSAEDAAKNMDGKDSISLMGVTCKWQDFDLSADIIEFLVKKLSSENGNKGEWPKSFLGNLENVYLTYYSEKEARKKKEFKPQDLERLAMNDRWRWMLIYQLKRFSEGENRDKDDIAAVQDFLIHGKWNGRKPMANHMELMPLILRWSRNLLRAEGGHDNG